MTKYIQGKDGKFAGSIGDGKAKAPTEIPRQFYSRKCDNCGNVTRDWTPRRWESTGDVEAYCSDCINEEATIAAGHDTRVAQQRFLAAQDKWTDPEAIKASLWVEDYSSLNDEGVEVETVEIGLENAPTVPFEMLSGTVKTDVEEETGKAYVAELSWLEPKRDYEVTSFSTMFQGRYSERSVSLGGFDSKEEAVEYVKNQIVTRMPRDIKFIRDGKNVPADVAATASANGYTLTSEPVRRSGIDVGSGYPVLSFQSKPQSGDEKSRSGYIAALPDGTYRSVVRWDDGARSTPDHAIFDTAEEAHAHAFNLLSHAPAPGFGQR